MPDSSSTSFAVIPESVTYAWLPYSAREIGCVLEEIADALSLVTVSLPDYVEVYLVDDGAICAANKHNLGCMGPTNVLSFPGSDDLPGTILLSLDTLDRECLIYGQRPAEHFWRLLIHGIVHIAGYDHGEEMDSLCDLCFDSVVKRAFF